MLVSADHPIVSAISENAECVAAPVPRRPTSNLLLTVAHPLPLPLLFSLSASCRWAKSRCACPSCACYTPTAAPDAPASSLADDAGRSREVGRVFVQPARRHAASLWPRLSSLPTLHFRISQSLYDSILPMVKTQVASQIKGAPLRTHRCV